MVLSVFQSIYSAKRLLDQFCCVHDRCMESVLLSHETETSPRGKVNAAEKQRARLVPHSAFGKARSFEERNEFFGFVA